MYVFYFRNYNYLVVDIKCSSGGFLIAPACSVRLNPSAVLDFLWACLHNPYLWRGRVRKEAVVSSCLSLVSGAAILPLLEWPGHRVMSSLWAKLDIILDTIVRNCDVYSMMVSFRGNMVYKAPEGVEYCTFLRKACVACYLGGSRGMPLQSVI